MNHEINRRLASSPVVALLGPRQCGKSTLARMNAEGETGVVHLDLELPSDLRKLRDPEAFFSVHSESLVVLDEIQRSPELFPVLRAVVDRRARNGQFLVLGSASPELLRQGSETLAGRIAFLELMPFSLTEVGDGSPSTRDRLWIRGGFPRSFLAADDMASVEWRADFVRTFLERDLAQLGSRIPAERLGRFWRMCAHEHGQVLNLSKIGSALGVSDVTVRSYVELFAQAFMIRLLRPCEVNLKKRLVKSPKIFVRDSGILHSLLEIPDHEALLGHPSRGASWEGLVIDHVVAAFRGWSPSFFRTQAGAEIDLILSKHGRRIAIEAKVSTAPKPSRGFWNGVADLGIDEAYVIAPVANSYPLGPGTAVLPLEEILAWARRIDGGERHPASVERR